MTGSTNKFAIDSGRTRKRVATNGIDMMTDIVMFKEILKEGSSNIDTVTY